MKAATQDELRLALPLAPAARDVRDALRFFTRAPLGASAAPERLDMNRFAWAAPIAGALVGVAGSFVLALTALLSLPPLICAGLATAALIAAAGALHEDGLADTADGFGGGRDRAAKLEIMRDSRIGTYGVIALVLALICVWERSPPPLLLDFGRRPRR